MYAEYWGLNEKPFELTPDQRYIYYSREHEEALVRLLYTVVELKGAMVLTGHYGCGKTTLSRVFLNHLMDTKYEVGLITNPRLNASELLEEIIYQFCGKRPKGISKLQALHAINDIIYSNLMNKKETVLVIDEAQVIEDTNTFEELRLLLNFQQNNRFLLTLILIGHGDLMEKLNQLPHFKQRLLIGYHINPLDENDAMQYIDHRMRVAGRQRSIFTLQAKRLIYMHSSGVPRIINSVADLALLAGYEQKRRIIDEGLVKEVLSTIKMEEAWSV